jgi:ribokinase
MVDAAGENRIVLLGGANATVPSLTPADREAIAGSDGLLLQLELPQSVAVEAAEVAADAGALVALTPAPVQPLADRLLELTGLLFVNEHEAASIAGDRDLLDLVPAFVVTSGERGSDYADRTGLRLHRDAVRVEAVDTTAAGDVYAGVFLATYLAGFGVEAAMTRATVAASICVTRRGTSGAVPAAAEIAAAHS